MMGTVDDAARPGIAALVAEYYLEKRSPDRQFQHVGAMLADCVQRDLSLLRGFANCVREIVTLKSRGNRTFVHGANSPDVYLVAKVDGEEGPYKTKSFVGFDRAAGAVSLLTRHGFGEIPTGFSSASYGGTELLHFSPRTDNAYLLLGRCLSVGGGLE